MRAIGVREFRDQATSILSAGETVVIERHGEPIGFYVPITEKNRRHGRRALGRLGIAVNNLLAQAGIDEDELVHEVAPKRRSR